MNIKCIKNDLSPMFDTLEIIPFFDTHIGSPKCDRLYLQELVKYVKDTENAYAIIGGDVINNSTRASVGDVYEESLSPMEQIKSAAEIFRPIKEKILCVTSGNHERRSYKTDGVDLLQFLCMELGIPDKYDPTACLCFIRFGADIKKGRNRRVCYTMYVTHGDGNGGRTIGGKANGLERRGQIVDADIIVTGHTHQPMAFQIMSYKADPYNNTATEFTQLFVNANSFLSYENYAQLYGMRPSPKTAPRIILDGHKKKSCAVV